MTAITEKEAAQKWCPKVQVIVMHQFGEHALLTNRGERRDGSINMNCIGTACMWWRRGEDKLPQDDGTLAETGYCGEAGKP